MGRYVEGTCGYETVVTYSSGIYDIPQDSGQLFRWFRLPRNHHRNIRVKVVPTYLGRLGREEGKAPTSYMYLRLG